jgi:hypothetical protein
MKWKDLGNSFEKDFSFSFHQSVCPVLLSSLLIRSIDAGQIDVAGLVKDKNSKKWSLILYELKISQYPGRKQWERLRRTQDYLSRVLEMDAKLSVKFCQKDEP